MRPLQMPLSEILMLSCAVLLFVPACGGDDDDEPPPPQIEAEPAEPQAPPGQVMVTVAANSTPPGASVVGGGRQLGVTPFQTEVPIPAPAPGQPAQSFAFTFSLAGYQPATINAAPVNNTISLTAALAPAVPPEVVAAAGGDVAPSGDGAGGEVRVRGRGGGPIYDNHTTTGTAVVNRPCVIDSLSVSLSGTHSYFGDLHITLQDPNGNNYSLARGGRRNPFRRHRVRRASGRQARGTWRLSIADRLAQDSGILRSWSLSMTCR